MRNFVFDKIPHILIDIEGNGKWGRSPNKASLAINALLVFVLKYSHTTHLPLINHAQACR